MSKYYLDKNGVSYFWSKIKAYVLGVLPQPYTSNPSMNGTASAGSSAKYAKGDHVHPSDTAKVSDVQVAGSSVVANGVADVPVASKTDFGVVKAQVVGSDGNHGQLKITYKANNIVSYALPLMDADDGTGKILGFLLPYATASKQGAIRLSHGSGSPLEEVVRLFYGSGSSDYYDVPSIGETSNQIKATYLPEATTSFKGAMSATDKTKLDGIASGAEANVQSDWNETDSSDDAYIANKPSIHNVPSGGTSGQVLSKASGTDYDVEWATPSGGDYTATSPIDITNDVISHDVSGVTAGSYGSYDSSTPAYYIPNITVDSEGHITSASESLLSKAGTKSPGFISADDWRLFNSPIASQYAPCYVGAGTTGYGIASLTNVALFGGGNAFPLVIGAYVYCNVDSTEYKKMVPADIIYLGTYSSKTGGYAVQIRIPSEYLPFCGVEDETMYTYAGYILYKTTSVSGSSM